MTYVAIALIGWGVNAMLTPPPRPVCYVIEPYGKGEISKPVWCDEVAEEGA
ncbi:hypothetical protein V6238_01720 [Marinomonas arenicola]|uniref:hypothetical protein n=1 Tax=Marinomonas arenicola TaxID=569601 RepID=UPI00311DBE3B